MEFWWLEHDRQWPPTPVLLPGESQGWRSLVGRHLWGCTESDTTEATQQQQQQQQQKSRLSRDLEGGLGTETAVLVKGVIFAPFCSVVTLRPMLFQSFLWLFNRDITHNVQGLKIWFFSFLICSWARIAVTLCPGILSDKVMSIQNIHLSFDQT